MGDAHTWWQAMNHQTRKRFEIEYNVRSFRKLLPLFSLSKLQRFWEPKSKNGGAERKTIYKRDRTISQNKEAGVDFYRIKLVGFLFNQASILSIIISFAFLSPESVFQAMCGVTRIFG